MLTTAGEMYCKDIFFINIYSLIKKVKTNTIPAQLCCCRYIPWRETMQNFIYFDTWSRELFCSGFASLSSLPSSWLLPNMWGKGSGRAKKSTSWNFVIPFHKNCFVFSSSGKGNDGFLFSRCFHSSCMGQPVRT